MKYLLELAHFTIRSVFVKIDGQNFLHTCTFCHKFLKLVEIVMMMSSNRKRRFHHFFSAFAENACFLDLKCKYKTYFFNFSGLTSSKHNTYKNFSKSRFFSLKPKLSEQAVIEINKFRKRFLKYFKRHLTDKKWSDKPQYLYLNNFFAVSLILQKLQSW